LEKGAGSAATAIAAHAPNTQISSLLKVVLLYLPPAPDMMSGLEREDLFILNQLGRSNSRKPDKRVRFWISACEKQR
jgi:hypothetical protein